MSHPPSARATAARDPPTMAVRYHGPRYTPAGRTVDDAPAGGRRARAGRARVSGARGARADHDRPAGRGDDDGSRRSEEHTSELQSHSDLVCRLLLEKKKKNNKRLKTANK